MDLIVTLIGIAVIVALVSTLINCTCITGDKRGSDAKPDDSINNNKKLQEVKYSNGTVFINIDSNLPASGSAKNVTINRRLPEIPPQERPVSLSEDVAAAAFSSTELLSARSADDVKLVAAEAAIPMPGEGNDGRGAFTHPYAKIPGQLSEETDTDDEPRNYEAVSNPNCCKSLYSGVYEPPPPPVPEKRFDANEPLPSTSGASAPPGTSGDFPAPVPLMMAASQELIYADEGVDAHTFESTDSSKEIRYTSISVREPLATIKAQMASNRTAPSNGTPFAEPHYSVVPDDMDQTYAEIESAQTLSTAAAVVVTPPNGAGPTLNGDHPPAPPTVESLLRSVAKAHSRHASTSSFMGDVIYSHPQSPVSDRPVTVGGGSTLSRLTPQELSDLYSTVDKSKKTAAPIPQRGTAADSNPQSSGDSVDEMYARVNKVRHSLPSGNSSLRTDLVPPPLPSSGSGGARPKAQHSPLSQAASGGKQSRRKSKARNDSCREDPGYEKINDDSGATVDHNYETLPVVKKFGDYETIGGDFEDDPCYEKLSAGGINDPTYEPVPGGSFERGPANPNYESLRYDTSGAANRTSHYWLIEGPGASGDDPLYEKINNPEEEPNYEKVKPTSELSYSSSEPGYERVMGRRLDDDDDYEVGALYERLGSGHETQSKGSDPGYERVGDRSVTHSERVERIVSPAETEDGGATFL